jgi:GT2 family glycosyltransferase
MKRIVALLTCFNRRALTLACIDALTRQRLPQGWELGIIVVDDGSKDGTAQAVAERFPQVRLIHGDGHLYWNGGMRAAMAAAVNGPAGVLPAQSMNGSLVAIFRGAWEAAGDLDPIFTHTMADFDYGLRARRHGVPLVVAPGYAGYCDRRTAAATHRDAGADLRTRWRNVTGPKGRPLRAWWVYTWRHAGWLAPLVFAWPYARALVVPALPAVGGAQPIDVRKE